MLCVERLLLQCQTNSLVLLDGMCVVGTTIVVTFSSFPSQTSKIYINEKLGHSGTESKLDVNHFHFAAFSACFPCSERYGTLM